MAIRPYVIRTLCTNVPLSTPLIEEIRILPWQLRRGDRPVAPTNDQSLACVNLIPFLLTGYRFFKVSIRIPAAASEQARYR